MHPRGLCESEEIGQGTRVWAFAHVLAGARIGRDCNICDGAFVENGASIGDRVTVKNQVMIFEGVRSLPISSVARKPEASAILSRSA